MSNVDEVKFDPNFEDILRQHNQAYADSEVFNDWMPPDGEYITLITKEAHGIKEAEGDKPAYAWVSLTGKIIEVDSPLNNKEYGVGFFSMRAPGIVKKAACLLADDGLQEKVKEDAILAMKVLVGSVGTLIRTRIEMRENKKYGRAFPNCTISEQLPAMDEATELAQEEAPAAA